MNLSGVKDHIKAKNMDNFDAFKAENGLQVINTGWCKFILFN